MFLYLGIWLALSFLSSGTKAIGASPQMSLPNCTDTCGNVSIPYPFGVTEGCFKDSSYFIKCNSSTQKAYQGNGNVEVLNITLGGQATFNSEYYGSRCFNQSNGETHWTAYRYYLNKSPFWFSATKNKFIATGCNTIATITDESNNQDTMTGCISVCSNMSSLINGSCSGIGCCQTPVPWGLKAFNVTLGFYYNPSSNWSFNPCSFAFLAEEEWFNFTTSDISAYSLEYSNIPVAMDWAVGNQTCEEAQQDAQSYACGPNSYCSNSTNGIAYLCNCNDGFEGNPYILRHGCQDINECAKGYNNSCSENAICNNTVGSYNCYCPNGYYGNGWENGTRCIQDVKATSLITIIAGVGAGFLLVFACFCFLYWVLQKRRIIQRREKFFQQNGGLLLQQQITSRRGVTDIARIFTMEELKKATNNFEESRILGQGGFGTVFKGHLSNGNAVAIKKSKIMDKRQIVQFINEVDILSQINHRNVVKLLGCCLETEVPLLVYEFISNGNLFEHIHNENQLKSLSWGNRLRIAAETAGALAYLHSAHSIPVIHRDVKSANILVDDNLIAKVSDFGASRLAPLDQTQATTLLEGTLGYLDPECFYTGQLIDKSDVYSFGVVLAELLTGKKSLLSEGSDEHTSLAMLFVSSVKDNKLFQILDDQIANEGDKEQLVAVSELAIRCLKVKGEDRPTMKEVAMELDSLIMLYKHPWTKHNKEETESLLGEPPSTSSTVNATCQESFGGSFVLQLEMAAR